MAWHRVESINIQWFKLEYYATVRYVVVRALQKGVDTSKIIRRDKIQATVGKDGKMVTER